METLSPFFGTGPFPSWRISFVTPMIAVVRLKKRVVVVDERVVLVVDVKRRDGSRNMVLRRAGGRWWKYLWAV